ncbi:purine permease (plasmid) [Niallia taxi]|uniref:nucleobase:cation symporter-2 family protein n=1 Tax=Niallia taxi TaxID=2499688 RepID=UPI0011AB241D|nr:nucleobase:cation symporter-2 family protein [Niallia taxi]MCT2344470.1 purine permease [Niallia taxi]MDE5054292.1 nucleobase:cation symporter-2 family protein [Niallia taxi]MED3961063.1 nucleobase:cation symporter-2 family protein [Niallia taxi]WOD65081.1 purine permease [Niallia taxi]
MAKGMKENMTGEKENISVGKSIFLGLQQVLAMDLFIPPIILAGLLSFSVSDSALLIQMTFIACGIATIIQAGFAMRLPVMQGPSFVPLSALAAIGTTSGIGAMIGSLIPGALIVALLGYPLKVYSKVVRKIIPPIVAGTVIVVVGLSLMPSAINSIYSAEGSFGENILIATITAAILIFCMYVGEKAKSKWKYIKVVSVVLALIIGSIIASFFGLVHFDSLKTAAWFQMPGLFSFGMPEFNLHAIIVMIVVYLIVTIETTGTWFTVSKVTGEELDDKRLNGGALGEGLGCFVGSFFGGTPVTGYSSNAGIIAITGVKSRKPIIVGGVILVLLGMMPKLTSLIACIPSVVVNSVFAILCVVIMMNGFKVIKDEAFTERNMLVIGVPIMLALFAVLMPADVLAGLPEIVTYFVSSGTAIGAIAALVLNLVLPQKKDDKVKVNDVSMNVN